MILVVIAAFFLFMLIAAAAADAGVKGYYRYPSIHRDTIVFAAEGDLWKVSKAGGLAMRLTTHNGDELFTKISPDGQWLAFSGQYQGNRDVYVMPTTGGEPRRLTYHPSNDEVVAWMVRQTIVFRCARNSFHGSNYRLFEVSVDGGQPKEINIGPAALASFSMDENTIVFNRFSREFRTWKRYYGGTAQDIWIGNFQTKEFKKITDWKGTDRFPMWYKDKVYFASDRSGTMNIYSMNPDGTNVTALTQHRNYDVCWPDMQREEIVYMHGGDLWTLNVETGENHQVEIEIPTDRIRNQQRFVEAQNTLDRFVLNKEGKKIAISSRGKIFVTTTKPGRKVQLTRLSGIRDRLLFFSPDGSKITYITDQTGEQEIAILNITGKDEPEIITKRNKGWLFPPVWSPDGKFVAYADLTMSLFLVDVENGEIKEVDSSDVREIREYEFSPDGKWLAYTKIESNQFPSVYIYNVTEGGTYPVTTSFSADFNPAWDAEGKYLYFLSDRNFNPMQGSMDYQYIVSRTTKPYAVILAKEGKSPFLPDELLEEDEDETKSEDREEDKEKDEDKKKDEEKIPEVVIDVENIQSRVVEIPIAADMYGGLSAIKGKLFYVKRPMSGRMGKFDDKSEDSLMVYDLKEKKEEVFIEKLSGYTLSGNRQRIAFMVDGVIHIADTKEKPKVADLKEKINPSSFPLRINPSEEWKQIFYEAWRLQRDFYWAENMANVDWEGMRQKYEALLPRISTRDELNDLIGQMIAELGTGHTYISGGDRQQTKAISVGMLGAVVELEAETGLHRFVKVLRPEPWETDVKSPLNMNHVEVKEGEYLFAIKGEYLFAINGQELTSNDNIYDYLANLAGEQVQLTVGTHSDKSDARDVQIETLQDENRLILRDWARRNREYVSEKSDGRFGYVHLPDMSGDGLVEFTKGFYPQLNTDGLIIDVRYNRGGNVSQLVIDRLKRKLWASMTPRRGYSSTYPARVHIGHKVVLTNQLAGSDGDIFPESFQILGLGPVIGMRSWGGVIGIRSDKPFIDGGMTTQPEFAWWYPEKGWGLENRGVEPDIEIDVLPEDWSAERDPQLDRAIAELEHMNQEKPVIRPQPPAIPDKSKKDMEE